MKIPYVNLLIQHKIIKKELLAEIEKVLDHGQFILGQEVKTFEEKFAKYCDVNYTIGVNSGTDALFLALKSIGIGKGDNVITVPNSFIASTSSIIATGALPIFVDVGTDMNINPDLIEESINENTKAILPVHLTGRPVEMDRVMKIAKSNDIFVIEDCAQAVGAEFKNKKVGSYGNVNAFSLHPLKTLNVCGDGGMITTNDKDIYNKLLNLRNIGLKDRDHADFWGYNSRLDTIQAAIANVKFKYLEEWTQKRMENANYYINHLKDVVKVPSTKDHMNSVYHTFIIQAENRDKLQKHLKEKGVETKIHYPIPIHMQLAAKSLGYKKGDFPTCERQSNMILSLPIYPELTKKDMDYIITEMKNFYKLSN
jgi:dTDP-4-amino-4,6-dideoxygalactose transaminase